MKRFLSIRVIAVLVIVLIALLIGGRLIWGIGLNVSERKEPISAAPLDCRGEVRFAIIGDFGEVGEPAANVAALVDGWDVDFIVTAGDNNYEEGAADTIDQNIGQYYHEYIHPYQGSYGPGATENRFFPSLGNHDWDTGTVKPHTDYFTLPGNERYYDFQRGPVQFFILDSDPREPDGISQDSTQAVWLEERLGDSEAAWRLVITHHPPYSSSLLRGDNEVMQWPFAKWGASAVIAGHEHFYERLWFDGIPQFTNGIGGRDLPHRFGPAKESSQVRYNQDFGAMLVSADETCINFSEFARSGELIDSFTLRKDEAGG